MKTKILALMLALTGLELWAQTPPGLPAVTPRTRPARATNGPTTLPRYQNTLPAPTTAAPAPKPADQDEIQPMINFQGVELSQVLDIYAQYVGRTLLRANLPEAKIILKTTTPLTKGETIQALQAVLALNNVSVINVGEKFVKVLPSDQANTAAADIDLSGSTNLPSLGSYVTHIVQLKYVKPSEMILAIQPFAKLANSILAIDSNGILVLRDYAENVKRMLEMIERIDVSVPAEFISEVIPIRYAKVAEIAAALNSLGGSGGGSTVSMGSSSSSSPISGFGGRSGGLGASSLSGGGLGGGLGGGIGGGGFGGSSGAYGGQNRGLNAMGGANGTPSAGTTFQQRLQNIVNRASSPSGGGGGQDQIQLFGQTKIIPDENSSSLLVFATRQDMTMIREIIAKLDVPLAQVLIEAIIMDVKLDSSINFGVSAAQSAKTKGNVTGAGGMNNGQPFFNFLNSATNSFPGNLTGTLPADNNFSYFGNIGQSWNLAVQAAESDTRANIIQRPRIQTSQAKPAQFFVGETKPYVTSTSYGYTGGYGGSSYSQLSVGVELDVTPYINPEGLVVMDIQQEIDDFNGTTKIDNVGEVPNTIKRTINTQIAVRDRDTVILGGFIKSDQSHTKNGVPLLKDIPLLGNLFQSRADDKKRTELVVLMRPTVLKTPELAAKNTVKEVQRLPGASAAISENAEYERKLIDTERKKELKRAQNTGVSDGFFNIKSDVGDTNAPQTDFGSSPAADTRTDQEKAREALDKKMKELDEPK
jgi:general secretion pathway protein D